MKVYIAYGWPEGPWHSKQLRAKLQSHGHYTTNHVQEADIIIAHSAGCFMLPSTLRATLILLVGVPNWPGKPWFSCTSQKVMLETKDSHFLQKTLFHILYGLTQPKRLFDAYTSYAKKSFPTAPKATIIMIHNELDTYMNPAINKQIATEKGWAYKELEGQHDDLWDNPDPYLTLIQHALTSAGSGLHK